MQVVVASSDEATAHVAVQQVFTRLRAKNAMLEERKRQQGERFLQLQRLRYDMQLEWKQLRRREVALRERAQCFEDALHSQWSPLIPGGADGTATPRVRLNVGGQEFESTVDVLCLEVESRLASLVQAALAARHRRAAAAAAVATAPTLDERDRRHRASSWGHTPDRAPRASAVAAAGRADVGVGHGSGAAGAEAVADADTSTERSAVHGDVRDTGGRDTDTGAAKDKDKGKGKGKEKEKEKHKDKDTDKDKDERKDKSRASEDAPEKENDPRRKHVSMHGVGDEGDEDLRRRGDARDDEDVVFIDRDWWTFRYVLQYLREGPASLPQSRPLLKQLYREAAWFGLRSLQLDLQDAYQRLCAADSGVAAAAAALVYDTSVQRDAALTRGAAVDGRAQWELRASNAMHSASDGRRLLNMSMSLF